MAEAIGVMELISTIGHIMKACRKYYKAVSGAQRSMGAILDKLGALNPQLELLQDLLEGNDETARKLQKLLIDTQVLLHVQECIEGLEGLLPPELISVNPCSSPFRRNWQKLTWPIMKQDEANELLGQLETYKNTISMALATNNTFNLEKVAQETQEIKRQVESQITDQEKSDILVWLKPDFVSKGLTPRAFQNEKSALQETDTCDWMAESRYWPEWLEGGSPSSDGCRRFLWIHGIPGAGKTILASYLIDQVGLYCGSKGYSYYYCTHEHHQVETLPFLRWIICDLSKQIGRFIPKGLTDLYEARKLTIPGLLSCLLDITKQFPRVYIIVDAVDESEQSRTGFLDALTTIGTHPSFQHVSLLMTSREEPDIKAAIDGLKYIGSGSESPTVSFDWPRSPSGETSSRQPGTPPNATGQIYISHRRQYASPSRPGQRRGVSTRQLTSLGPIPDLSPNTIGSLTVSSTQSTVHQFASTQMEVDDRFAMLQQTSRNSSVGMHDNLTADYVDTSTPSYDLQENLSPKRGRLTSSGELRGPAEIRTPKRGLSGEQGGSPPKKSSPQRAQPADQACTILSMSNPFVHEAIRLYIQRSLDKSDWARNWPRQNFVREVGQTLAGKARGMFRWVACQIDIMNRLNLPDEESILNLINDLPDTLFDTYERIIVKGIPDEVDRNEHNRKFARIALALICSNTSEIPSVDVLVEASRFNVPQGTANIFNAKRLRQILGCLVKVTTIRKKPASCFPRQQDDEPATAFQRLSPAHYTVKEYLYSKETAKGPAKDFALSSHSTQTLELQVVFYGLQHFGRNRTRHQKHPTRYEEFCLKMTEQALRKRPHSIVKEKTVWEAVLPCLVWDCEHQAALSNSKTRQAFPCWAKLAAFEAEEHPRQTETSILVSLLLLEWPELAKVYLATLSAGQKNAVWTDHFKLRDSDRDSDSHTILELCVVRRRIDFLEHFVNAGATFFEEPNIIFTALQFPYGDDSTKGDDGATTGELIKMLLERGANPNPSGYRYTPLQFTVRHHEAEWVQNLLLEGADANATGDPDGEFPKGAYQSKEWHGQHPLKICENEVPPWQDTEELDDDIRKSKARVRLLLLSYAAVDPDKAQNGGGSTAPPPKVPLIIELDD